MFQRNKEGVREHQRTTSEQQQSTCEVTKRKAKNLEVKLNFIDKKEAGLVSPVFHK